MTRHPLLLYLLLLPSLAWGVPAKRVTRLLTLPDGTRAEAVLRGDECLHYYETPGGGLYQLNASSGARAVSRDSLRARWQAHASRRAARRVARRRTEFGIPGHFTGQKRGLVLLVNFSDVAMSHTRDDYRDIFNLRGYSAHGFHGSVRDYFLDASYGQFDLSFDVAGPYTVSRGMAYYGQNDADGNDRYAATMVGEAVRLADADVDFSRYDWDGDGEADQVLVVYAGHGEAQGAPANTVWPHEFTLSDARDCGDGNGPVTADGVRVDTYACTSELAGASGSRLDGIGTACHEFSHCLGLPDMYDTGAGTAFGMDMWDLMDYGSYAGPSMCGECPVGFTAYERWFCGWLQPEELDAPLEADSMPALTDAPAAYILRNGARGDEYYLLENRQPRGWDTHIGGHGLLVVHVDYSVSVWQDNGVNATSSHQRMTVIPADGRLSTNDLDGDPYPGAAGNTRLTDTSRPAAALYNANSDGRRLMGHAITDIAESDGGLVSFLFDGGMAVPPPAAEAPSAVTAAGFTARWSAVEGAEAYELSLTETASDSDTLDAPLLEEDFAGFNNGGAADGTVDVGQKMDSYTARKGWTGQKVFTTPSPAVKLGSSKALGSLQLPPLAPLSGQVTVLALWRGYGSDAARLTVSVDGDETAAMDATGGADTLCVSREAGQSVAVTIATASKRAYVDYVAVYDGAFTPDELLERAESARRRAAAAQVYQTRDTLLALTGLDAGRTYIYKVRARVSRSFSPWSAPVEVTLPSAIAAPLAARRGDTPAYNLAGQRVGRGYRGIVVSGGRKTLR